MKLKNIFRRLSALALILCSMLCSGCIFMRGGYSFTGASIPDAAKTFSVAYFPNNAPMVSPTLSTTLVEADGDFAFEGEITGYSSTTASVSSDNYALLNRLTITVKVRFTNKIVPEQSFNQSFSAFTEYDSSQLLTDIQQSLDEEIVKQLVTDIFQAAASNW